ncbi:MAG: type II toxin-antitoxin system HicB family antitoxin [Candidatus Binataceae bacterium]|jgi:predicted RNase H-like HicB family nuclease
MRYAIAIEKSADGYGAYVPDLPGCAAIGDTVDETEALIREAIVLHLAAIRNEGQQISEPSTLCDYVDVQA